MRFALFLSALLITVCATSAHVDPDKELTAFMTAYTLAWNKHDAGVIARDFYRLGQSVEDQTASLKKQFDGLVAQGYDKSLIQEIKACAMGPDTGWAGMHFSRLKTDGEPLPPKDRASQYDLMKFPDGWRITKLSRADPSQPLACPRGQAKLTPS